MRKVLLSVIFFVFCETIFANQNWQYKQTKNGVTLIAALGYDDSLGWQRASDAFLDLLDQKTRDVRGNLPVLLILDQPGFRWYDNWKATMAYDTLREFDYEFIESYYYYRMSKSMSTLISNLPSDRYKYDLPEPLDINASFDLKPGQVGLKIIYSFGDNDRLTFFDRIFTLTRYGCEHIEKIKTNQTRNVFDYHLSRMKLSLLTLDTGFIASIPLIKSGFIYKQYLKESVDAARQSKFKLFFLACGIGLLFCSAYFLRYLLRNSKASDPRIHAIQQSIYLLRGFKKKQE